MVDDTQAAALLESYVDRIMAIDIEGSGPLAGSQKATAMEQYSALKDDLKKAVHRLELVGNQPSLSQVEKSTVLPALKEALVELHESVNTANRAKLQSNLYSAKQDIKHYLAPLQKKLLVSV